METKKNCINCGEDISYKKSKNAVKCEKCKRQHYARQGTKVRERSHKHSKAYYGYSKKIVTAYGGRCAICKWRVKEVIQGRDKGLAKAAGTYGNQIHHIIPVSEGGTNEYHNLILLCPNHHKQADYGIISINKIRKYQVPESTNSEPIMPSEYEMNENMKAIQAISDIIDGVYDYQAFTNKT